MCCQKQRTAKKKQGHQKDEPREEECLILGNATQSCRTCSYSRQSAKQQKQTALHQVKSQKLIDRVLDVIDRQNDKEGRGFMKLHEAEIKITILYKKPQHAQYIHYQGILAITIPVCEQYSGVLKHSVATVLKDMSGLVFLNKCPCLQFLLWTQKYFV